MPPLAPTTTSSSEPEPPFRPREKILEKQRYFQSVRRPTYLKGRHDVITSVAIPLALALSSMYLVVSTVVAIPRLSFVYIYLDIPKRKQKKMLHFGGLMRTCMYLC